MPDEKKNLHELEKLEVNINREQIEKKREIVKEEIERGLSPEQGEARVEKKTGQNQENEADYQREKAIGAGGIAAVSARQKFIKEREKKIEGILAEGLEEIYLSMPPQKQKEFKEAGEEAAKEINNLLQKTKIKIGKIIKLIKKWLTLIPGVNKYFLEQEAKIKADEIMAMKNELDHI